MEKSYEEWEPLLLENDIPIGAINNIKQAIAHPQVEARNMLIRMEHPVLGEIPVIANPMALSDSPPTYRLPPPALAPGAADPATGGAVATTPPPPARRAAPATPASSA